MTAWDIAVASTAGAFVLLYVVAHVVANLSARYFARPFRETSQAEAIELARRMAAARTPTDGA